MSATVRTPEKRRCERCGRTERWNDEAENWRVAGDEVGELYCIHSWDITGRFNPIGE